jgi:hypothetical protein
MKSTIPLTMAAMLAYSAAGCEFNVPLKSAKNYELDRAQARERVLYIQREPCSENLEDLKSLVSSAQELQKSATLSGGWDLVVQNHYDGIEISNEMQRKAARGEKCPEALEAYGLISGFRVNPFAQELAKGESFTIRRFDPLEKRVVTDYILFGDGGKKIVGTNISVEPRTITYVADGKGVEFKHNPKNGRATTIGDLGEHAKRLYEQRNKN